MSFIRRLLHLSPLLTALLIPIFIQQEGSTYTLPLQTILDLQYSPDGKYLAQVYTEGRLEVIETEGGRVVLEDTPKLPNSLVLARVDWSSTGNQLAVGIGFQVYIWDVEKSQLLDTVEAGGKEPLVYTEAGIYVPEGFVSLEWDSTNTLLLAQTMSARYSVWSIDKQAFIFDLTIGNDPRPIVWLPGDQRISYLDNYLDIQTQEMVSRRPLMLPASSHCGGIYNSIDLNRDGTRIAWGTSNGCVFILDADTGDQLASYKIAENDNVITGVSWSPDGSMIIAVDSQGGVQVVDVATGQVTLVEKVEGSLYTVDWSETNSQIAFGGGTEDGETLFAAVEVAEVERLMASSDARQAELLVTPPPSLR